ncbi:MAG: hypothetical protein IJX05_03990 [Clostridia bacterium]|nr:hypothetical protein [Clostridia bacterium]
MRKNYDDYYVSDLVRDLRDDAVALKRAIELFGKLRKFFSVFSVVWSYVTVLLFVGFGVTHLLRTSEVVLPVIAFAVSGVYLIVNTIMLILARTSKERKKQLAKVRKVFRVITIVLKLGMIAVTVASLVGVTDDPSVGWRITWCLLSVFWLGITVSVDIATFLVKFVLRTLKEIAEERVRRVKAAVTNTVSGVKTAVGETVQAVKNIGSGIKNLFSRKSKEDSNTQDTELDPFD